MKERLEALKRKKLEAISKNYSQNRKPNIPIRQPLKENDKKDLGKFTKREISKTQTQTQKRTRSYKKIAG